MIDGSAKCDAFYTDNEQDCVWGVVYFLSNDDISLLDQIEGQGYDRVWQEVETEKGELLCVNTYQANCIDPKLLPYEWYKRHVLVGATECGLAAEYIAEIEAVPTQTDPEQERVIKELSIYV